MRKSASFAALTVVIFIFAACSSSEPAEAPTATLPPPPPASVQPYLESVRNHSIQVAASVARIDEQLSRVWPLRSSLFTAFEEAGLAVQTRNSLAAIAQLVPPPEYADAHQLIAAAADGIIEQSNRLEAALEAEDLSGMQIAVANIQVQYESLLLELPLFLCQSLAVDDNVIFCQLPSGEPEGYAASVERLMNEFKANFGPRVGAFPPAMSDEERFRTLASLNLEVERATQNAEASLKSITPPSSWESSHEALLKYFQEIGETATAISVAGRNEDGERVQELFGQSGIVSESAASNISCSYNADLLRGFFPIQQPC